MIKNKLMALTGFICIAFLTSCGNAGESKQAESDTTGGAAAQTEGKAVAQADLFSTADSTKNIGNVKFFQEADGQIKMEMHLNIPERADSNVAVHFHEHGDCGNKGDNTHGHWNPTNETHGKWGSAHFHAGDIGNIMLDNTGHGMTTVTTNLWSVADTAKNDIVGRGIIVHGGTDDYTTQPTGNSGPRIGCGVISKL
jgi:Cu-Zn family superoxide dismutase